MNDVNNVTQVIAISEADIGTTNNVPDHNLLLENITICPIDDHQTMGIINVNNFPPPTNSIK